MAYINHQDLAALSDLFAENLTAWEGEEDSVKEEHAELIQRLQDFERKLADVSTNTADDELIEKARSIFQKGWGPFADEIEIDDFAVGVSRADDGTWVNAWVWVPNEETGEDEE